MPYDDEEPPYVEPDREVDELVRRALDAAFEVYRETGPGLDESIYEAAMCRELELRGVPFQKQVIYAVYYKGTEIGSRRVDLLLGGRLIIEIKAAETLLPLHKAQLLTYLKISGHKLGLLINFNSPFLKEGIKRVVNPRGR